MQGGTGPSDTQMCLSACFLLMYIKSSFFNSVTNTKCSVLPVTYILGVTKCISDSLMTQCPSNCTNPKIPMLCGVTVDDLLQRQ